MGFAKYREDDMEIMIARLEDKENKKKNSEMKDSRIYFSVVTSSPACKIGFNDIDVNMYIRSDLESSKYKDKMLTCINCGAKFLFSANAQQEYNRNGWCDPKRCKTCRDYRRTHNNRGCHLISHPSSRQGVADSMSCR